MQSKKSFTLIEMLIVVVIIGILAAALIPRLQSVQARARDTKRKADLHQIATALEVYKQDYTNYNDRQNHDPCADTRGLPSPSYIATHSNYICNGPGDCGSNWGRATYILPHYMTSVPIDSSETPRLMLSACYRINDSNGNSTLGYGISMMNHHKVNYSQNFELDSFILVAKTESDGSSSNWVTNTIGDDCSIATGDSAGRHGEIGDCHDNANPIRSQTYQDYMCTTVALSGDTTNDGNGTCTANKNGDDLRYIYVQ